MKAADCYGLLDALLFDLVPMNWKKGVAMAAVVHVLFVLDEWYRAADLAERGLSDEEREQLRAARPDNDAVKWCGIGGPPWRQALEYAGNVRRAMILRLSPEVPTGRELTAEEVADAAAVHAAAWWPDRDHNRPCAPIPLGLLVPQIPRLAMPREPREQPPSIGDVDQLCDRLEGVRTRLRPTASQPRGSPSPRESWSRFELVVTHRVFSSDSAFDRLRKNAGVPARKRIPKVGWEPVTRSVVESMIAQLAREKGETHETVLHAKENLGALVAR